MPRENRKKFASNFARCFALDNEDNEEVTPTHNDVNHVTPTIQPRDNHVTVQPNEREQIEEKNIIYSSTWNSSDTVTIRISHMSHSMSHMSHMSHI